MSEERKLPTSCTEPARGAHSNGSSARPERQVPCPRPLQRHSHWASPTSPNGSHVFPKLQKAPFNRKRVSRRAAPCPLTSSATGPRWLLHHSCRGGSAPSGPTFHPAVPLRSLPPPPPGGSVSGHFGIEGTQLHPSDLRPWGRASRETFCRTKAIRTSGQAVSLRWHSPCGPSLRAVQPGRRSRGHPARRTGGCSASTPCPGPWSRQHLCTLGPRTPGPHITPHSTASGPYPHLFSPLVPESPPHAHNPLERSRFATQTNCNCHMRW